MNNFNFDIQEIKSFLTAKYTIPFFFLVSLLIKPCRYQF